MDRRVAFVVMAPLWLWGLLPLWAASGGAFDVSEMLASVAAGAVAAWFLLCAAWFVVQAERFSVLAIWLSVPAVWTASSALAFSDVPMQVRFRLSETALRRYAETEDPDPPNYGKAKGIGLFNVDKVWRQGRTVAFATDSKPFDRVGVIYAPDGLPVAPLPTATEELLRARYTHLNGPWYKFEIGD